MSNKDLIEELKGEQRYFERVQPRNQRDDKLVELFGRAMAAIEELEELKEEQWHSAMDRNLAE